MLKKIEQHNKMYVQGYFNLKKQNSQENDVKRRKKQQHQINVPHPTVHFVYFLQDVPQMKNLINPVVSLRMWQKNL